MMLVPFKIIYHIEMNEQGRKTHHSITREFTTVYHIHNSTLRRHFEIFYDIPCKLSLKSKSKSIFSLIRI